MSDFPEDPSPNPHDIPPPPLEPPPPRRFENQSFGETPYGSGPNDNLEYAMKKLNAPAICLMVAVLISALWCCYNIIVTILASPESNAEIMSTYSDIMDLNIDDEMMQQMAGGGSKIFGVIFWAFMLLINLFLFYGAVQIRSLKNYGLAMTTAIIATIPCCFAGCCVVNMPFGIWLLTILRDPVIKASFWK